MTAETAYRFLKPSLEKLTERQKEKLCELISGDRMEKIKYDPVPSVQAKKRILTQTIFKNYR